MKLRTIFFFLPCLATSLSLFSQSNIQQSTSINVSGAAPDPSALLDVQATDKGMLVPRMTTAQRAAIASPATGLLVFDTDTGGFWFHNGTAWTEIGGVYTAGAGISIAGNTIGNTGDTNPADDLTTASTAGGDVTGTFSNLQIAAGTVGTVEIADGTVTVADLAAGVIPTTLPPSGAAGGDLSGMYPNPDIAASTVGTAEIGDGTVTVADLAAGVIPTTLPPSGAAGGDLSGVYPNPDIAASTVGTAELADGSVTDSKISSGAALNGRVLTANGAGGATWAAPAVPIPNKIEDADGDTKIQVEESADEDIIRFDLGGTEKMVLRKNASGTLRLELFDDQYNTFVGEKAGSVNTTGINNTANGYRALYSNTIGSFNTANGTTALYSNITGYSNTANGTQALYSNTDGYFNTANGRFTLYSNSIGGANSAHGYQALSSNTIGNNNTANGVGALFSNTTGNNNTANGFSALSTNVAGSNGTAFGHSAMLYANSTTTPFTNGNVAVGFEALRGSVTPAANTGNSNTAIGYQTLLSNTTGSNNMASGSHALYSNTTGIANTANGTFALYFNNTGYYNTASGYQALYANTTGYTNTASGFQALYANTTGYTNTASGYQVLFFNTGNSNTASGSQALYANTSGGYNTASGSQALYSNTSGGFNTASGSSALYYNTGALNTASGWGALSSNTTGSYNTAFGALADVTVGNLNNATAIGYNAKVACSNCMVLGGTGADAVSVGIGATTVPSGIKLQVNGNVGLATGSSIYVGGVTDSGTDGLRLHHAGSSAYIDHKGSGDLNFRANNVEGGTFRMIIKSNGNIGIGRNPTTNIFEVEGDASKSSAGDWLANSDARLKKNISPLNSHDILEKLLSLQGVTYEWNDDKTGSARPEGIQYGFTAQNIREAFPTLVEEDALGYLQTPYGTYDAMTVEAIRALNDKITALEAENEGQKLEIEKLRNSEIENAALKVQLDKITAALHGAGIAVEK